MPGQPAPNLSATPGSWLPSVSFHPCPHPLSLSFPKFCSFLLSALNLLQSASVQSIQLTHLPVYLSLTQFLSLNCFLLLFQLLVHSELRMESWAPNSASSEERFAFPSEDVGVKVCAVWTLLQNAAIPSSQADCPIFTLSSVVG